MSEMITYKQVSYHIYIRIPSHHSSQSNSEHWAIRKPGIVRCTAFCWSTLWWTWTANVETIQDTGSSGTSDLGNDWKIGGDNQSSHHPNFGVTQSKWCQANHWELQAQATKARDVQSRHHCLTDINKKPMPSALIGYLQSAVAGKRHHLCC